MPTRCKPVPQTLAIIGAIAASHAAVAQTASVEITHDHPTGVVSPGEVVELTVWLRWHGSTHLLVHSIAGDVLSTNDLGTASGQTFHPNAFISPALTVVNLGTPRGGSVVGIDLQSGLYPGAPNMPFGYTPWVGSSLGGLIMVRYDWTAPSQPGVVNFDWVGAAGKPDPLFWVLPVSFTPSAFPTTYTGASLTVIPAPPAALVLLLGAACARRRR